LSFNFKQAQYKRENIPIYSVKEDKDTDDGEKVLFSVTDELDMISNFNDIQRVHRLRTKKDKKIHAQSLQALRHTRKETSFLLTNRISKTSKADNVSLFVRISHL